MSADEAEEAEASEPPLDLVPDEPEPLGIRDHLIHSGGRTSIAFPVGSIPLADGFSLCTLQ